ATGHCTEGVCCDSACSGQCESCKAPGRPAGTCSAVTGQPAAGHSPCVGTPGEPCAGECDGTNRAACIYDGPGTVCAAAECSGHRARPIAFCNGAGKWAVNAPVDCPSGCDGTQCGGGCTGTCGRDEVCSGGVCVGLKSNGEQCGTGAECISSFCV